MNSKLNQINQTIIKYNSKIKTDETNYKKNANAKLFKFNFKRMKCQSKW